MEYISQSEKSRIGLRCGSVSIVRNALQILRFRCYHKLMRRTDGIFSARAKFLSAALSVVGLSFHTPSTAGVYFIHANVEARSLCNHVDLWIPTSKRMASMEISGPKRIREAGAKTLAQAPEPNDSPADGKKAVGCHMNNVWYPEGAIYPPQEPGRMTGTVVIYVCKRGKWLVRGKSD